MDMGIKVFTDGEKWQVVWDEEDWTIAKNTYASIGLKLNKTKQPFGTRTTTELEYYQEPNNRELANYIEAKRISDNLKDFPSTYKDDVNASPINNIAILRVVPTKKVKGKIVAEFKSQEVSVDDVVRNIPLVKGVFELLTNSPSKAKIKEKKKREGKKRVRE